MQGIWAVVPVKDGTAAKGRLAGVLDQRERRGLFHAMLEDVLSCLSRVDGLSGTIVVTRDARASALARSIGARVIREARNDGQSAAVRSAAAVLGAEGATALLTVPGDVPLIAAGEIEAVMDAHGPGPSVTLVPARDGGGTNCLVCSPPDAFEPAFGTDSFARHRAAAQRLGITPEVVLLSGLGLDVDTPGDLEALLARPLSGNTGAYLDASGIAARLGSRRAAHPAGVREKHVGVGSP
ncbi:MAG: 2-phospho-L-lactate guanylyltransferase [Rhodospirillales bacterium]|nr:2-phospho-L-lactate guanylyltransferase [Rhodospirillales bacterium]MDP6805933.1 2-phospho-L-lactate guanylyltransferase [Rhodospirillales bacterium]